MKDHNIQLICIKLEKKKIESKHTDQEYYFLSHLEITIEEFKSYQIWQFRFIVPAAALKEFTVIVLYKHNQIIQ